ncbi:MAG TPA: hypothetical protein VFL99_03790 [Segeticoccus sp.]|uniref:hypothetical protein n=1 Tax=Segeticoccus sp. TaxID=2706531 RepID=UPI002D7F7635|nr:hypothetical protein [Segeticoccus sp.]HET8599423.1 hypothetical protein [Segeticoccus sp.]
MTSSQYPHDVSLPRTFPLAPAGYALGASGVLGVAAGVFTLAWPHDESVPADQWSYPFSVTLQHWLSGALGVTHLLTVVGVVGLLAMNAHHGSRAGRVGLLMAASGLALLAGCEWVGGSIADQAMTSTAANRLNVAFGLASILVIAGCLVAGSVILRRSPGPRWATSMLLASGLVFLLLVTPANFTNEAALRMPALMLWSLCFVPLGIWMAKEGQS